MTDKKIELRKQAEEKASHLPEEMDAMSPEEIRQTLHELRVHQIELTMQNEELRQSQAELDAAGDRFFDFYDLAPVGYFTLNKEGLILEANLTAAALLGVARDDLIRQPFPRYILKEDADSFYLQSKQLFSTHATDSTGALRPRAAQEGTSQSFELRMLRKDGSTFWAGLDTIAARDADGAPVCHIVLTDVTERKQKDEALRESEERFHNFFMKSPVGINGFDAEGRVIAVNSIARRYFGVREDDPLSGYRLFEDPSISEETKAKIRDGQIATEERFIDFQAINKHKMYDTIKNEDDRVYIHFTYTPYGPIKNPTGYIVIIQDITERKRFEEVQAFLAQTSSGTLGEPFFEALARYLAQNLGMDYVCIDRLEGDELTARTVAVWCDGHFEDNVTYALKDTPCGDVVGKTVCCFPAGVCQLFPRDPALQDLNAESYVGVTLFDHTGRPIGLIAVIGRKPLANRPQAEAILKMVAVRAAGEVERLVAEEALKNSNAYLENLINYANAPIIVWDPQFRITRFNHAFEFLTGRSEADVLGKSLELLFPSALTEDSMALIRKTMTGERWETVEIKILHCDKSEHTVLWNSATLFAPDGQTPIATIAQGQDITSRKRMEEELLRAQKLESLGTLAGGIAHDFNNLLGVVQGYMDLVLTDLPPGHVSRQLLLTAMRSVSQTKDLTSRLITFSKGGGPIKEIFDVAAIIREAVQRTVKGTKVRVNFNFRDDLWPAEVDDLQMKQVFNNLTKNAVEATPAGGILTIQAENALLPAGGVLDLQAGAYLKITFTDEGIGIHEEHLAKIFDPYFSTKRMAAQNGLGLGLAVCYSVLKSHDGHITVQSLPGKGASFVLYIPARPELAKGKAVQKTTVTPSRVGPVRVLIMDDDPQARDLTRAYLERMEYEVTDVQHGQEAIDAYRKALESGTPFDLALLDLKVNQGMGGEMALKRLLAIAPTIKAILVSGYVDDPVMLNYADHGFQGALKKPFTREEMKHLLEKVLHE